MKTIGIIGGLSWESTLVYYKIMNEYAKEKLGGYHSAKIILYSFDFSEVHFLQVKKEWEKLADVLIDVAKRLQKSGADFLVIASNTTHMFFNDIKKSISIPVLHIADATAATIKDKGLKRVGLLGTKLTMEKDFYIRRLESKHGIETIVPGKKDRDVINNIIFNELVLGRIKESSREKLIAIIESLVKRGAEGIILGCTEIPLLIKQKDVSVPIFNTTSIHAKAAVNYALRD